jgi:hypothetical protein
MDRLSRLQGCSRHVQRCNRMQSSSFLRVSQERLCIIIVWPEKEHQIVGHMQDARRAGGGRPAFTAAVLIILSIVAGLFIWRVLPTLGAEPQALVSSER